MTSKKEKLREEILKLTGEYVQQFLIKNEEFSEGDKISYAGRVFDEEEVKNLVDSSLDFWLTSGRYCSQFEKEFSDYIGVKYCLLVNSGSSANLLAFMSLTSPLLGDRQIKRGDEIITVACGFPTTIAPIVNFGAIPVFVDVEIPSYNINCSQLENAITTKTKAVMLAHTLGNPFNIKYVREFCEKHNLWLIEDNCDALGSLYTLDGITKKTGTFGDIGTSSFYPPHHMTMGEGGAVCTNNPLLNKIMLSMRDWGRDCICNSGQDNLCGHRFDKQFGQLPIGYDHKYVYSHFGYNLKATEMQAAIGVAQIKKLKKFIDDRQQNFQYLKTRLSILKNYLILPNAEESSIPSWFGFTITVKDGIDRNDFVKYIEKNNIQTRMLFASNITLHPCFEKMREDVDYKIIGQLSNTNIILNNSFWIGVAPTMSREKLDYIVDIICNYFDNPGK